MKYAARNICGHVIGGVSPAYVVGSDKYVGLGKKEFSEYVRNNKARFAKGLARSVGGLALGGLALRYGFGESDKKKDKKREVYVG